MKNSTKLKIINWVKKVLKYYEPVRLPLKEETRKIQEVRWEGVLFEWDAKHEAKRIIANEIANELSKLNVIDYKVDKNEGGYGEGYRVRARAFFIEPIERWENER